MASKISPFSHRPALSGALGLGFLNLLLFGDLLWKGESQVLSSPQADLFLHFTAWRQFGFEQLRQGHLVLWNPHYLCGAPFFGGFEAALLYPPNWLHLFLPLGPALNLGIILHVFFAGFFTYLWALHRGMNPLSAFVTGVIFMWGGAYYLHLFAGHLPNLCSMVWGPLILLSVDALLERPAAAQWLLLGIFAVSMQVLAGHPQYVYFTAIIAWIYGVIHLDKVKASWTFLASLAAIYAGASLLTAVQLWTGIQAYSECSRNIPLAFQSAASFSFPPENILTLILPGFFGNLAHAPYWGRWYLWEVSAFMGVTAFFLVVLTAATSSTPKKGRLLAMAGITVLFSLGAFTPLYHFFYDHIPLFKGLRGSCKFDYLAAFFLAGLAGMGLDQILHQPKAPRWSILFCLLAGLGLTSCGLFLYFSARQGLSGDWAQWFASVHWLKKTFGLMDAAQKQIYATQTGLQAARSLGIGGSTFFTLAFLLKALAGSRERAYALSALCILELFLFARANRPTFDLSVLQKKFEALEDFHSKNPGDYRVYGTGSASLVTGLNDIWEDEPMVLGRYGRFVCRSQNISENQLFSTSPVFQKFPPALGLLRLKYRVFMNEDPLRIAPFSLRDMPRVKLVSDWKLVPDSQKLLDSLFNPAFDPTKTLFLESPPDPLPSPGKPQGEVRWTDLSTDQMEITADIPRARLLFLTDNFSTGWHARAFPDSGQNHYQIMPADSFLRAVPLAAGHHHFLLEYRPLAFEAGKWVSIVSCFLYFVWLLQILKRRSSPLKAMP